MNILRNSLILFGSDCRIQVIGLEGGKDSSKIKFIYTVRSACKLRARRTEYKSVFFHTT